MYSAAPVPVPVPRGVPVLPERAAAACLFPAVRVQSGTADATFLHVLLTEQGQTQNHLPPAPPPPPKAGTISLEGSDFPLYKPTQLASPAKTRRTILVPCASLINKALLN